VSAYDVLTNSKFVGSVVTAITTASLIGAFKYGRDYLLSLRLKKRLEEDRYTPAEIKNRVATTRDPYIRPDCQDSNPANPESAVNRRPIFQEIDRLLGPPLIGRFVLLLADSGMGKSTFLERYYAYHWRSPKRSQRFKPIVIPLNGLDADDLVKAISVQARGETVLLLDALDEDNAAIKDFADRFSKIVEFAGKFRAVVVTCRTQFLADVACVPDEIDLPAPSGPMALSGSADQKVRRLFLAPFSDLQIEKYLAARFPYWHHPILRVRGGRAARRFKDLMSRPLLLTHIEDLAAKSEEPKYSFQVYRAIVDSWLNREVRKKQLTSHPADLLALSEKLASELFMAGRDRIPNTELQSMAVHFHIKLEPRDVRQRSLLHNDAEGNWKFAHRSIMEYLLVNALCTTKDRPRWVDQPWSDQMRAFAREMLLSGTYMRLPWVDLQQMDLKGSDLQRNIDLSGANLSHADMSNSLLKANLSGGNLNGTCLRKSSLLFGDLRGASLINADLSESKLAGADMTGADLSGARLCRTSPSLAKLRDACLNHTDLSGANLSGAIGLTLMQCLVADADEHTIWPVRTLTGHAGWVNGVVVTRDGQRAVSASEDKTLKVWDLASGRELRTLTGHACGVTAVALTPDGQRAVSASEDKTLKVWELASGRELRTLTGHANPVTAVAVTPDGQRAVSAAGWPLKVWDLGSGCELATLTGHSSLINAVVLTPDGQRAVSASADKTLKVWELASGRDLRALSGHAGFVRAVVVTPDGQRAVSASEDQTLKVWEIESGRELRTLSGHANPVTAVAVTPDGQCVVSASQDKTLRVWFPPDEPEAPSAENANPIP